MALDPSQSRQVARTHWQQLREFLHSEGTTQPPASRTNAREKLTRLTRQQFQELSTDVYDELMRRRAGSAAEPFLPQRSDFHPKRNQARQKLAALPKGRFRDLASDVFFELERRYPEFNEPSIPPEPSPSAYSQPAANFNQSPYQTSPDNRNQAPSLGGGPSPVKGPQNEVLIPNKSTLVEDDGGSDLPPSRVFSSDSKISDGLARFRESPDRVSLSSNNSKLNNGISGLGANRESLNRLGKGGNEFYDKMNYGGISEASRENTIGPTSRWGSEEIERIRSDYEVKLATLQTRVTGLERDLKQSKNESASLQTDASRARDLEDKLSQQTQRTNDQVAANRSLRAELESVQAQVAGLRERQGDQEEVFRLRRELESSDRERNDLHRTCDDLRREIEGLLEEVRGLQERYDDVLSQRDADEDELSELKEELEAYKRKYEAAKTDLRNFKATSQLFAKSFKSEDHFPPSEDGIVADIHVTRFQSSIDALLSAARSNAPSSVLPAMKSVVVAVNRIESDITRTDLIQSGSVERPTLESLKQNAGMNMNNLVGAVKAHATSFGMSPVSIVDATASHLSTTVIELVKLVGVRRATGDEVEDSDRDTSFMTSTSIAGVSTPSQSPPPTSTAPSAVASAVSGLRGMLKNGFANRNGSAVITAPPRSDSTRHRADTLRQAEEDPGLLPSHTPQSSTDSRQLSRSRQNTGETSSSLNKFKGSMDSTQGDRFGRPRLNGQGGAPGGSDTLRGADNTTGFYDRRRPSFSSASSSDARSDGRDMQPVPSPRLPPSPGMMSVSSFGGGGRDRSNSFDTRGGAPRYGQPPQLSSPPRAALEVPVPGDLLELKNYLEVQTEAIVQSIQSLLSAVRSGGPSQPIGENLTRIITIVSSIVAIARDSLPPSVKSAGTPLLNELTDNCDKLSEIQSSGVLSGILNKDIKQALASASFGVAKALKALNNVMANDVT